MVREQGVLGASLLLLALLALVASGSHGLDWETDPRDSSPGHAPVDDPRSDGGTVEEEPLAPDGDGMRQQPRGWLTLTGTFVLLGLLAAAVLTVALLARLRFVVRRRRRPGQVRGLRAPPLPEADPAPGPEVLTGLADAGLAALDVGRPRNGVVAAWVALEQAVESAGLPRDPADTAADLVRRTLAAHRVDAAALDELAGLYREARFSEHEIGEPHRNRARDCLDRIRTGLRTKALP